MHPLSTRLFPSPHLMDSLFGDFAAPRKNGNGAWNPSVQLRETDAAYLIQVELPGVDPTAVELTVEKDTLTIKGEKKSHEAVEGEQLRLEERRYGAFTRTFRFPTLLTDDLISASAKHGLLTVEVKKAPEITPRRIEVKVQE